MAKRRTALLSMLLLAGFLAMAIAYFRMGKFRDDAALAQTNLQNGQRIIKEIRQWKSSPGRAAAATADEHELTRLLRQAATAAQLTETPGIEPENPKPLGNTDYSEMAIDLRFEQLTLRQLTIFLHNLAQILPSSRARNIELSIPTQPADTATKPREERWQADVAVGYLTYTPRKPK